MTLVGLAIKVPEVHYSVPTATVGGPCTGEAMVEWTRDALRALAQHSYARGISDARRGLREHRDGVVVSLEQWLDQRTQSLLSADTRTEENR